MSTIGEDQTNTPARPAKRQRRRVVATLAEDQASASAEPEAADETDAQSTGLGSDESPAEPDASSEPAEEALPHHGLREKLRDLERRTVELPVVGKFHTPDKHDFVYYTGIAALITLGIVEWPIALAVVGGHLLVKQHQSRTLSAIGEVMEDFWH